MLICPYKGKIHNITCNYCNEEKYTKVQNITAKKEIYNNTVNYFNKEEYTKVQVNNVTRINAQKYWSLL